MWFNTGVQPNMFPAQNVGMLPAPGGLSQSLGLTELLGSGVNPFDPFSMTGYQLPNTLPGSLDPSLAMNGFPNLGLPAATPAQNTGPDMMMLLLILMMSQRSSSNRASDDETSDTSTVSRDPLPENPNPLSSYEPIAITWFATFFPGKTQMTMDEYITLSRERGGGWVDEAGNRPEMIFMTHDTDNDGFLNTAEFAKSLRAGDMNHDLQLTTTDAQQYGDYLLGVTPETEP